MLGRDMFELGMIIVVAVELGCAGGLFYAFLKLREYTCFQAKEDARIQKEWGAVADKYEELAKYAEELAKVATRVEERDRLQVMSKGYAEIYGGSKPDPDKVN